MKAGRFRKQKIGLLGGSFNPAHEGHRYISQEAIKRLGLDAVWWLVSPQNPLKSPKDMAPFEKRLAYARQVAHDPRIIVTNIEKELNTRYTVDSLRALQARFPETEFIWLMGADNMLQFHRWKDWKSILKHWQVVVFAREGEYFPTLKSLANQKFPDTIRYINVRKHPASGTKLRAEQKGAIS